VSEGVITINVPSVPVAQPRPRAAIRGRHARVYNAAGPVDAFKACVRLAAKQAFSGAPYPGPLRVDAEFVFPRTKGETWKTKPMPRMRHAKKPDRDNLDKAVLDALSGLLWIDDAQVCDGCITKWIASGDEQPGVTIIVTPLA
jgi:crossover junction endodeoxyribonuclease RusA